MFCHTSVNQDDWEDAEVTGKFPMLALPVAVPLLVKIKTPCTKTNFPTSK